MMKKLSLLLLSFINIVSFGQDNLRGGTVAKDVLPIARTEVNNAARPINLPQKETSTSAFSTGLPTGNSTEVGTT